MFDIVVEHFSSTSSTGNVFTPCVSMLCYQDGSSPSTRVNYQCELLLKCSVKPWGRKTFTSSISWLLHPSSHCPPLIRGQVAEESRSSRALQASFSPSNTLQLLLGDPEAFPGQKRYIIPPAGSGSASASPPSRTCPENLERQAPGRHPDQMPEPPQLTPFDAEEQRLYSELPPDVWAPHLISKAEPSHPPEETQFGRLYPRSPSFGHYPQLTGEGWNVDGPVNRELRLPAQLLLHHNGPVQRPYYCRCRTNPSVHLIFPSLMNKTPRYLNSFAWGSNSLPTRREHSTVFRQRRRWLSSQPASHSAANRPSACWRSRSYVANRTTSSAKSRDAILMSPKRTLSSPRLRLEILSVKITNRIGDKGQPWRSPTPTENVFDFVPRMRTQLSLCLYRDRMARPLNFPLGINKVAIYLSIYLSVPTAPVPPYPRSTPHRIPRGTRS